MYPKLLELGPISIYSYGLLLVSAYLLGLQVAVARGRARGLNGQRVMDLGIAIIISALVGAKLMLFVVEFDHFTRNPAELWTLVRSGGVFYGGLLLSVAVAFWYMRRHALPLWATCDAFAPGIAARAGGGPPRLSPRGLLLRPPDGSALGHHVHRARWPRPTSARRSTSACTRRSSTNRSPRW